MVDGYMRNERKEHNNRMSLAWHTAAMTFKQEMPSLESLLILEEDETTPEPVQTVDNMLGVCKMLNAAYGGNVIEA